jgi:PAS domain S-box-containing protein
MKQASNPIRLLIEILAIVAVAQAIVILALPAIAPGLAARSQMMLGAAILLLLSGPTLYWRCMAGSRSTSAVRSTRDSRSSTVGSAIAMTAAAQALGLMLTGVCVVWQQRSVSAAAQEEFNRSAERIEAEVQRHFALPLYGLNGLRGMFLANGDLTRSQFRRWVESRNLPAEFPGVRGLGYIERVKREDVSAFVAAQQADGSPEYVVDSAGEAPDLYLVKYIEPIASNRAALGKDAGREAVRREAVERAASSGLPALSGRITLAQDGKQGPGFLYLVPVYREGTGATPATAQQRQSMLIGLLYVPIVAAEIMKGVTDVAEGVLDIELFEGGAARPDGLLFDSRRNAAAGQAAPDAGAPGGAFRSLRTFVVGGRTLALQARSTPAFEASVDQSSVIVAAVGGVMASFIMALAVWLLAVGRVRAQRRAQRMTADLTRLARVAQHTSNSVAITDAQMRINWVNEGFTRITGYTLEEATGRTPGELLGSGKADPATIKQLMDALQAGQTCRVEILNRAKDGHEYWVDTEVQPTHDEHGVVTGFMEVGSDITAQKRTQMQLETAMRESDALLRTVHQHAIVSVADRTGRIIEVNDAFCIISGYARHELLGQNHRIVNSDVQPAEFWLEMWQTISGGSPWRGQICNRAKNGSLYWVDSMIAPFIGPDGKIEKYISIRTDISASKAAQLRLSELADRLTLAIEGGSDGLWDWMDVGAEAEWWSPSFYAMLGYQPSELAASIGSFTSLLHPRHLAKCQQATEEALSGARAFDMELLLRTQAGEYRWFRSRAKVYFDAAGRATRMAGSLQDIHDRKQAERDLGRERQRLGHILEGTNVGTWEWNIETGETHFNERWAQIIGRTLDELGTTTIQAWTETTHPEDQSRSAVLLEAHFNGDLAYYECETRMQHKDGHWVWVLDRGKLFSRSDDGRPRWMAGTRMDITQRKLAEQALRDSEAFLDRAGRIAGVGGWLVDLQTGGIHWSDQTCRIHDMAPGHQPSMDEAVSFYAPAARPIIEAAVQESIAHGRPFDLELSLITATGRHIWVRAVGETESEDGKPVRLVGAFQDITERRALDEELRRSNELMTGVLQNLPCGLSVFNRDLQLVAHNNQFRGLMNLPDALFDAAKAGGATFDRFVRFSAQRGEYGTGDVEDIVAQVIEHARRPAVQFFERERPNDVPLEIRRAPLPDGGFVATYTDISTRKQAEAQLKEALTRAEQASVTKSQFLANMSHEIRTPMNAILGMLALLQKTALTPRQLDYAAKTERAARSLLGLLNDILDFSKAEAGKMTLDPRPFRVDRLLRDLSVILSANVGAKTIDVLFDIDPLVPPCLLGDDLRLQQVLINLGGNAIKFTAQGEVVLSVRVVERTEQDVLLKFAVRDSGIGIAPENQAHIFTGFSQAEASTTRRFGGTGLGLAICQRLVGLMGGELHLDSILGEGSTFHFQIRLALAAASGHEAASSRAELGAMRTLIVDDNASALELFVSMAQALGWHADGAASGAEAIAMAQARSAEHRPYETVFVDWQMPDLDGWETGRRLLHISEASEQPAPLLVMITGHGRETLAQRSAEEQAILSGFLVKPVIASMLFDAVSDARMAIANPGLLHRSAAATVQRLAGMRLLVVEDNLNNQQVAQELLTDEGAHVTLAANGQLGVDAVAAADRPFDAVLMDVQMPVMDGCTATAQIRQHLGLTTLPIIAMTANAMASDREACLAAGMNDHVGKPFDLSNLVVTLLRHTGRAALAVSDREPTASAASPELVAAAERQGIDLVAAIGRMGGNSRVYLRTLLQFSKDLETLPDQLAALLLQGQFDEAARLMHTVKGLAATLGIRPLGKVAADAESSLGTAEAPAQALIEKLGALVATTRRDIGQLAEALQQPSPVATHPTESVSDVRLEEPAADIRGLRKSLDELTGLLRRADMRALEVFEQLQVIHAPSIRDALQPLDEAMASLDFDQALAQCQVLKKRYEE